MTFHMKFIFHLKNGNTFSCIEEVTKESFNKVVNTIRLGMRENISGTVRFNDCCIRLSDCSVVEWEVINES